MIIEIPWPQDCPSSKQWIFLQEVFDFERKRRIFGNTVFIFDYKILRTICRN